jgi:sulfoxide reductase heme-binding subunit YedZ
MTTSQIKKPTWKFRVGTYVISLVTLLVASLELHKRFDFFESAEAWSMIFGYLAFILIGITLLIGPVKQWISPKLTPYCLALRRDVGIMAGAAATLHVALVLYLFEAGHKLMIIGNEHATKGWLGLFFVQSDGQLFPQLNVTGIANYLGAVAFLLLLALWVTSSRRAETFLGGSSWKRLHQNNRLLYALVIVHAVIYVQWIKGEPHELADILWPAAVVCLIRIAGFVGTAIQRKSNHTRW